MSIPSKLKLRGALSNENRRLRKIQDELHFSVMKLAPLDLLTASHLDWALIHVRGALRELDQLLRIAQYEDSKRGGK